VNDGVLEAAITLGAAMAGQVRPAIRARQKDIESPQEFFLATLTDLAEAIADTHQRRIGKPGAQENRGAPIAVDLRDLVLSDSTATVKSVHVRRHNIFHIS